MTGIRFETQKTSLIGPCFIVPYLLLRSYYVLCRKQKARATGKPAYRNSASKAGHSESHNKNFQERSTLPIKRLSSESLQNEGCPAARYQPGRGIILLLSLDFFFFFSLSESHYKLFPLRLCSTDIFPPLGRDEPIL